MTPGPALPVSASLLREIAASVGTPFYAYSSNSILRNYRALDRGLRDLNHRVFFAVKANSNISILKLLLNAGAGLDIVSGGELFRARSAGAHGSDIVFSGVGKTPEEMAEALACDPEGIGCFNVESSEELRVLSAVASSMRRVARIAFRFNPDVDAKTHPYISTGLKKNKFGMHRAEILALARNIDRFPGVQLEGVSIHIGSQLLSLAPLDDAFRKVNLLIQELHTILTFPLRHVDLGGGLGISYSKERAPPIERYCQLILKHFGPAAQRRNRWSRPLSIMLEPGRLLAGNAGTLVTQVLYWKKRERKQFLVVDAGMNDLIRPSLYESHHEIVPLRNASFNSRRTPLVCCDVVGPVCETGDFFARDRRLPSTLKGGDFLAILSAGAYGFSMSSNYNSRLRPPEVLVENGRFRVVRERETYADLIRHEVV